MIEPKAAGWLSHISSTSDELLEHPAVVLRVLPTVDGTEKVLVIQGTSQPRSRNGEKIADDQIPIQPSQDCFFIEPNHPDAVRLKLTKRTYFTVRSGFICDPKRLRFVAIVSDVLLFELRRLIGYVERPPQPR